MTQQQRRNVNAANDDSTINENSVSFIPCLFRYHNYQEPKNTEDNTPIRASHPIRSKDPLLQAALFMHVSRILTILRPRRPSRLCTPRLSLFCKMCSRESSNEYSWLSGFREQNVSTMSEATAFITCTFPLNCLYPLSTSVPESRYSINRLRFSFRNKVSNNNNNKNNI